MRPTLVTGVGVEEVVGTVGDSENTGIVVVVELCVADGHVPEATSGDPLFLEINSGVPYFQMGKC